MIRPNLFRTLSTAILAAVPAFIAFIAAESTTFPWCDEIALCDGAFMRTLHGLNWSGASACAYNPLYPFTVSLWAKIFGASHLSVCALSIAAGYLATLLLISLAHRRKWWSGVLSDTVFIFLFWGGWSLSTILSTARPEPFVLLFTVVFTDFLTRDLNVRKYRLAVFISATFLFLSAVYILPILLFFGIFMLLYTSHSSERKELLIRGLYSGAGFSAGLAITLLYYLQQQDILRLLGSYIYFNTITGHAAAPLTERITKAYLVDISALAAVSAAFVLNILEKRRGGTCYFILFIPLFMTLAGRYAPYYSWAFYIPSIVYLSTSLYRSGRAKTTTIVLVLGALSCAVHPLLNYSLCVKARAIQADCENFVARNSHHIKVGTTVTIAENVEGNCAFYYPLIKRKAIVWFRGESALSGKSDEEKFAEGVAMLPVSDSLREKIKERLPRYQRVMPILPPTDGLLLFYSRKDAERLKPLFERNGRQLKLLDKTGELSLWEMRKPLKKS